MDLEQSLWWLSILTECAALSMLLARGIARSYRWFAFYLAFGVIRGIGLHFAGNPNRSSAYAISWMVSEPILLALLVLTTSELVAKIPGHYRGFGAFGRQRLRRLLDIAVATALVSSAIEAAGPQWSWSVRMLLVFMIGLHRITTSILAVYLFLVAIFVSRVRVPFQKNLPIHSRLLACYLWLQTGIMLWQNLIAGGKGSTWSNLVLTGGSAAIFCLWALLLTLQGEQMPERKILSAEDIRANEERERALREAARRYSDRPLG